MPLNVLQVASSFPNWGGTELHILNLSEQLVRRGHNVTIACRPGRWVEERAQALGLPTIPVTVERLHDRQDLPALRRFLRENRTDVLHAHWSLDMIVPPVAGLLERTPVRVLSRHMPHPLKSRAGGWIYSNILFSRVITVSESVRQTLIGSGMSPGRVETIHHGTDVEAFAETTMTPVESRRQMGIPDEALAVGIVGRIASEKGHQYLFEAAKILGDRYPLRYVVIGDGHDEAAVRQMAQDMGLGDKVIFTGFRADANNAISALDIVAVPSIWAEPCSAVVQQGMALRRPVIGTRAGGTPEMIVEDETGLLVPVADAAALAGAIARLAGDAGLRRRMGAAGRSRVEAHFSLSVMTDKVEALYRREYAKARGPQALQKALVP